MLRRGFTLVELLLVTAILCVVAAVAVPLFVKSIKGNRMRAACRAVISAGRFAHSMALLQQQDMRLVFDQDTHRIAVHSLAAPVEAPAVAAPRDLTDDAGRPEAAESEAVLDARPAQEQLNEVLDGVKIVQVTVDEQPARETGKVSVKYGSNGRCVPYAVTLQDERGVRVAIEVDALGASTVEDVP